MTGSPHTCPTSWAPGCWTHCWHPRLGCGHGPGCSSECHPPPPQPAQPGQDCPHFRPPGAGERVELPCRRACGGHGARRSGRGRLWRSWCWRMAEALCLAHHNCTIPPRAEHVRGPPEESGKQAALFEFKDLRLSSALSIQPYGPTPTQLGRLPPSPGCWAGTRSQLSWGCRHCSAPRQVLARSAGPCTEP